MSIAAGIQFGSEITPRPLEPLVLLIPFVSPIGYRILYTSHAQLTHAEKASREETIPPGNEVAMFLERWQRWIEDDTGFHPGFRRDTMTVEPRVPDDAWYL